MTNPMSKGAILRDAKFLVHVMLERGLLSFGPPTPDLAPAHKTGRTNRPRTRSRGTTVEAVHKLLLTTGKPLDGAQIEERLDHGGKTAIRSAISSLENQGRIKRVGTAEGKLGRLLILWKAK
jgi:hypothetical protein